MLEGASSKSISLSKPWLESLEQSIFFLDKPRREFSYLLEIQMHAILFDNLDDFMHAFLLFAQHLVFVLLLKLLYPSLKISVGLRGFLLILSIFSIFPNTVQVAVFFDYLKTAFDEPVVASLLLQRDFLRRGLFNGMLGYAATRLAINCPLALWLDSLALVFVHLKRSFQYLLVTRRIP